MLAWGKDYRISLRRSEYHGKDGVYKTEEPVHLAEIRIGSYPYAGWGLTMEEAVENLRERIRKAEAIYSSPPDNTTDWHKATRREVEG